MDKLNHTLTLFLEDPAHSLILVPDINAKLELHKRTAVIHHDRILTPDQEDILLHEPMSPRLIISDSLKLSWDYVSKVLARYTKCTVYLA